jgi:hypothetical protein
MTLPPPVVHDILMLGLASSDNEALCQTVCIVLCVLSFAIAGSITQILAFFCVDLTCLLTGGVLPSTLKARQ